MGNPCGYSTSSPASEGFHLVSNPSACIRSRSANRMGTPAACSASTGQKSGCMKTSARLRQSDSSKTASGKSISSAAGSRVRTYPAPVKGRASKEAARVSGQNTPGSSGKSDPVGSLLRTCLLSEVEARIGSSVTWKEQVTPSGRSWWVLSMPGRDTSGKGCGLWPTAIENDRTDRPRSNAPEKLSGAVHRRDVIAYPGLYRTPVGYDATPGGPGNHYKGLGHQAKYPAPTTSDATTNRNDMQRFSSLSVKVKMGRPGVLNPRFVEWLMGFPLGWTDFAVSEMPSSPRSSR